MEKLLLAFATACMLILSSGANAGTYTWIPAATTTKQSGTASHTDDAPQQIIITGERIRWGVGSWDFPLPDLNANLVIRQFQGVAEAKILLLRKGSVCFNPIVSSAAKSTTSANDSTTRWLAAQEVFNALNTMKLLSTYIDHTSIGLIIDGKNFKGFTVFYADGASEVWVVNPGWSTSSVKLFDQPAPNSLTQPDPDRSCSNG